MKKVLIPLVSLLVCVLVVAGCSSSTTPISSVTPTQPTAAPPSSTTAAPGTVPTAPPSSTAATIPPRASTTTPVSTSPTSGNQKYGGTLTWIATSGPSGPIGYPPEILGPNGVTPQISLQPLLKEMLDGSMAPGLAASYDTNSSAQDPSITLHLQQGVKFSDGTDFNAAAVKWNLDNIKTTPYYAASTSDWKSVEVVDNNTVTIHLNIWQNTVLRTMGDVLTYMVSPTAFQKNGLAWMEYNMVGTGPFVQSQWQRDVVLAGTKNTNYWETGKPYLDGVKYLFVSDELTGVALFKSGGADVIGLSDGLVLNQLAAAGDKVIAQYLGPTSLFPDGNNPDSPWSNLKVRQAAAYAIDNNAIATTLGYGYWKPAYQFATPSSKAYDPSITGYQYDPAKAKQLLADAGYPNGFKTSIIASPIFLNTNVVLAVQNYLAKVGIQADVQYPGFAQYSDMSTKPWKNALIYSSVNEWGNENSTFQYFLGDPPTVLPSTFKPADWKATLDASVAAPQQDTTILHKLENMVNDNAMAIPIYYGSNTIAFAPYVNDTGYGTRGQSNWWEPQNTWLNK